MLLAVAATLYSPAFAALAAGCALFLYVSYAMPIGAGLLAIGKGWATFGPFDLGIWYKPLALVTVLGVAILVYAGLQPPNNIVVNYAVGVVVVMAVSWFGLERHRFKGPPIGATLLARRAVLAVRDQVAGEAVGAAASDHV